MTCLPPNTVRLPLAILLLGVVGVACGSAEMLFGPPLGSALLSIAVPARPFGLAVGRGVALVTQLDGVQHGTQRSLLHSTVRAAVQKRRQAGSGLRTGRRW